MKESTSARVNIDAEALKAARLKTSKLARENDWRWIVIGAGATIGAGLLKVLIFERYGK